jgi:hypothetical protein
MVQVASDSLETRQLLIQGYLGPGAASVAATTGSAARDKGIGGEAIDMPGLYPRDLGQYNV